MLTRGRCLAADDVAVLVGGGAAGIADDDADVIDDDESNKSCWTCNISTYSSRPVVFVAFNLDAPLRKQKKKPNGKKEKNVK